MILKNILLIILSALTFNISSLTIEDKYYTFNPNNIATNSPLEIELTHNFGIDQGVKEVQSLSEVYDADSFENFELELTVKSMTEQSLLIHSSYSMNIAKGIGFKAGLEGFSMTADIQQTNTFNIGISQQYTYGKEVEGSRRDFKAYLIVDLYNTIAFENGELA